MGWLFYLLDLHLGSFGGWFRICHCFWFDYADESIMVQSLMGNILIYVEPYVISPRGKLKCGGWGRRAGKQRWVILPSYNACRLSWKTGIAEEMLRRILRYSFPWRRSIHLRNKRSSQPYKKAAQYLGIAKLSTNVSAPYVTNIDFSTSTTLLYVEGKCGDLRVRSLKK